MGLIAHVNRLRELRLLGTQQICKDAFLSITASSICAIFYRFFWALSATPMNLIQAVPIYAGELPVVAATIAFGMGIDKAGTRSTTFCKLSSVVLHVMNTEKHKIFHESVLFALD